jgi:hypothetical protein
MQSRALQIELRLSDLRLGKRDARGRRAGLRLAGGDLLRLRVSGAELGAGLIATSTRQIQPALSRLDGGFRLDDLRLCSFNRGLRAFRAGNGRIVLLLRDLILREQAFEPLDIACRLGCIRFLPRVAACAALSLARATAMPCSASAIVDSACDTPPSAVDTLLDAVVSIMLPEASAPASSARASASSACARASAIS